MPSRCSRNCIEIGPGWPSPIVHSALALFTDPTGVITAAVPHAKTSVSAPEELPSCHSSVEILPSSAV